MGTYAEYNGKVYPATIRNGKCRLRSGEDGSGFEELIDSLIEFKEPILHYSGLPKERKVVPKDEIEAYWEDLRCPLVI